MGICNSGLVWRPDDREAIRFGIARGVQFPSLTSIGAFVEATDFGVTFTGTPYVKPSVVTNYEIGWNHAIKSSQTLVQASVFHQHSEDLLSDDAGITVAPQGLFIVSGNVGHSDANGLELEIRGNFAMNYRWGVNYRPERITDHLVPYAQNGAALVDYQDTNPLHMVKANFGWAPRRWEIDGYLHFQSATQGLQPTATGTELTPIAPYASVDSRVGYSVSDRMTLSVSGQNLTEASQRQTSGPNVQRRLLGTMSIYF